MKQTYSLSRRAYGFAVLLLCLCCTNLSAGTIYMQTNLVSSVPTMAPIVDSNLINPWGVAFAPKSPFWVSDQGTDLATLYDGAATLSRWLSPLVHHPARPAKYLTARPASFCQTAALRCSSSVPWLGQSMPGTARR